MNGYGLKTFYGERNILEIGPWVPDDIIHSSCIQREINMYPRIGDSDFLKKTGSSRRAASAVICGDDPGRVIGNCETYE